MQLTIFLSNIPENQNTILNSAGTIDLLINHQQETHDSMLSSLKDQYEDIDTHKAEYQSMIPATDKASVGLSLEFINNLIQVYTDNKVVDLTVYE